MCQMCDLEFIKKNKTDFFLGESYGLQCKEGVPKEILAIKLSRGVRDKRSGTMRQLECIEQNTKEEGTIQKKS